jgi:hypothetical protein
MLDEELTVGRNCSELRSPFGREVNNVNMFVAKDLHIERVAAEVPISTEDKGVALNTRSAVRHLQSAELRDACVTILTVNPDGAFVDNDLLE